MDETPYKVHQPLKGGFRVELLDFMKLYLSGIPQLQAIIVMINACDMLPKYHALCRLSYPHLSL